MKTIWIKCNVIGTGKVKREIVDGEEQIISDDSYRPEIIDKFSKGTPWSAVYCPNKPPYNFCVVRLEVGDNLSVKEAGELKETEDWENLYEEEPSLKHRWLDQPVHPAKLKK